MKKFAQSKVFQTLVVLVVIAGATGVLLAQQENILRPPTAEAQGSGVSPLLGFAWSAGSAEGSGLGWISLSSTNCDFNNDGKSDGTSGCPAAGTAMAAYGVFEDASGNLSGYAWSSNLASGDTSKNGWISFNDNGCPSGISGSCAPHITSGAITGWARACAALSSPSTCSGNPNSNAGGWDGWIHLSGTAQNGSAYGPKQGANCYFSGYSWGDTNFGWIDWNPSTGGGAHGGVGCSAVQVQLTANPSVLPSPGGNTTLTWSTQGAQTCGSITSTGGPNISTGGATQGSAVVNVSNATTVFTLSCTGPSGSGVSSTQVNVSAAGCGSNCSTPPSSAVSLTASPATVSKGSASVLNWNIDSSVDLSTCKITSGNTVLVPQGGITSYNGSVATGVLNTTTTFTLTCGSASAKSTIRTFSSPIEPGATP